MRLFAHGLLILAAWLTIGYITSTLPAAEHDDANDDDHETGRVAYYGELAGHERIEAT